MPTTFPIYIADGTGPKTGLSPTWESLYALDGTDKSGSAPAFVEIGGGWYSFDLTYGVAPYNVDVLVGVVDAGSGLIDSPRYRPVVLAYRLTAERCAALDRIGSLEVTYLSPVAEQAIMLYHDENYDGARILTIVISDYAGYDLAAATGKFRLLGRGNYERNLNEAEVELNATIAVNGSTIVVTVGIEPDDLDGLSSSPPDDSANYRYQVIATTAAAKLATIVAGWCTVTKKIDTPSP